MQIEGNENAKKYRRAVNTACSTSFTENTSALLIFYLDSLITRQLDYKVGKMQNAKSRLTDAAEFKLCKIAAAEQN